MFSKLFMTGVAGAALFTAIPAAALIKIAQYTGTITGGYDNTGVFGSIVTDMTGTSYVSTYTYDTSLASVRVCNCVDLDIRYGGVGFPGPSPIIMATLTINGVTRSVPGAYYGWLVTYSSGSVQHDAFDRFQDSSTLAWSEIRNDAFVSGAPGSLDQNFGPAPAVNDFGWAQWVTFDYTTETRVDDAYFTLNSETYSVSDAVSEAVPEPATWALMVLGFGMVGGAIRRKARTLAA